MITPDRLLTLSFLDVNQYEIVTNSASNTKGI